jgi:hypothetical protein
MLVQAIYGRASHDFILKLLDKGATLDDSLIVVLAGTNNIALTKLLLPRGLNLHYVNEEGKGGLTFSVLSPLNKDMFYFLLDQGVDPSNSGKGMDPLDLALQSVGSFDEAINYATALVKHDAPIRRSHIQQLALLAISSPKEYSQLEQSAPQLLAESDI